MHGSRRGKSFECECWSVQLLVPRPRSLPSRVVVAADWLALQAVAHQKLDEARTAEGLRAVQQAVQHAKERALAGDGTIRGDEWVYVTCGRAASWPSAVILVDR
jgi:hypothetical protein